MTWNSRLLPISVQIICLTFLSIDYDFTGSFQKDSKKYTLFWYILEDIITNKYPKPFNNSSLYCLLPWMIISQLLQGNRENISILPVSGKPCHLRLVEDNLTFHPQGISDDKEFRLETTRNNERDAYSDHRHRSWLIPAVPSLDLDCALLVLLCDCMEADMFTTCMARNSRILY